MSRERKQPADPDDGNAVLDRTIALLQPRYDRERTREDARQIIEYTTGYFKILIEWDRRDRISAARSESSPSPVGGSDGPREPDPEER